MAQYSKFSKYLSEEVMEVIRQFFCYRTTMIVGTTLVDSHKESVKAKAAEINLKEFKEFQEKYPKVYKRLDYLSRHFLKLMNEKNRQPVMYLQQSIPISFAGGSGSEQLSFLINLDLIEMPFDKFVKKAGITRHA